MLRSIDTCEKHGCGEAVLHTLRCSCSCRTDHAGSTCFHVSVLHKACCAHAELRLNLWLGDLQTGKLHLPGYTCSPAQKSPSKGGRLAGACNRSAEHNDLNPAQPHPLSQHKEREELPVPLPAVAAGSLASAGWAGLPLVRCAHYEHHGFESFQGRTRQTAKKLREAD